MALVWKSVVLHLLPSFCPTLKCLPASIWKKETEILLLTWNLRSSQHMGAGCLAHINIFVLTNSEDKICDPVSGGNKAIYPRSALDSTLSVAAWFLNPCAAVPEDQRFCKVWQCCEAQFINVCKRLQKKRVILEEKCISLSVGQQQLGCSRAVVIFDGACTLRQECCQMALDSYLGALFSWKKS